WRFGVNYSEARLQKREPRLFRHRKAQRERNAHYPLFRKRCKLECEPDDARAGGAVSGILEGCAAHDLTHHFAAVGKKRHFGDRPRTVVAMRAELESERHDVATMDLLQVEPRQGLRRREQSKLAKPWIQRQMFAERGNTA